MKTTKRERKDKRKKRKKMFGHYSSNQQGIRINMIVVPRHNLVSQLSNNIIGYQAKNNTGLFSLLQGYLNEFNKFVQAFKNLQTTFRQQKTWKYVNLLQLDTIIYL